MRVYLSSPQDTSKWRFSISDFQFETSSVLEVVVENRKGGWRRSHARGTAGPEENRSPLFSRGTSESVHAFPMRQKRAKSYKKLMHLYCMSFGFRQPFQVLGAPCICCTRISCSSHPSVDSQMCTEAVASKSDLPKQLSTTVQGTVKPSTPFHSSRFLTLAHLLK